MKVLKPAPFIFIIFTLTSSCHSTSLNNQKQFDSNKITIDLQPFLDIGKQEKNYVFQELKKVYPFVELKDNISLPQSAFNANRNRYRADSLIQYLGRLTPNRHVTIGITSKDISTEKGKIADWGVMGLGFCPGNACVVSCFRLSKTKRLAQLFKVSIHEIGHTQGLPHCSVAYCFMRDAEGRNTTDEETDFCPKCKAVLVKKGWEF